MAMLHRITTRGFLTVLLGLSLGACSFSYSSGSRSSAPNHSGTGKPVHHSSSGKAADTRGKPISRGGSGGSGKAIPKGDTPDDPPPARTDTSDDPPQRTPTSGPPTRTKVPPKRTKVPPSRTPVDTGTEVKEDDSPAASTRIKAKTKSDNPSASDNLVAPN